MSTAIQITIVSLQHIKEAKMTKHYEFVPEDTIKINCHKLTRIRGTIDLPQHVVKAGDLGGYIEDESNDLNKTLLNLNKR